MRRPVLEVVADATGRIIGYVAHCHHTDTNMLRIIYKCNMCMLEYCKKLYFGTELLKHKSNE